MGINDSEIPVGLEIQLKWTLGATWSGQASSLQLHATWNQNPLSALFIQPALNHTRDSLLISRETK